jgi:hypothetical protein
MEAECEDATECKTDFKKLPNRKVLKNISKFRARDF